MLLGSPPPTRGKAFSKNTFYGRLRITPAYAGKRESTIQNLLSSWDHPRLRGEKFHMMHDPDLVRGSPPPTRGKANAVINSPAARRITPAYAGKRYVSAVLSLVSEDHPRLRGEKFINKTINVRNVGSPPPTRGKGMDSTKNLLGYRITPAYAGKSEMLTGYWLQI